MTKQELYNKYQNGELIPIGGEFYSDATGNIVVDENLVRATKKENEQNVTTTQAVVNADLYDKIAVLSSVSGGLTDDQIAAINNVVNGGYVTIAGDETITGEKTFNNSVVIAGPAPLYIGGTVFKRKSNSSELSIEPSGGIDIISGDLSVSNGSIYADEFHCNSNDSNSYVLLAGGGTKALSEIGGQGGYVKPNGGIPKTDLASDVQTSLGKADTAIQPGGTSEYVLLADGSIKLIADIVSANPGGSSSSDPENPTTPVNGISSIYIATGDSTGTIKYRIDSGEYQSVGINGWDALSVSVASKADKSQLVNSNNGTAGFVKTIIFNSQSYTATEGVFTLPYIAINNTRIATEGSGNSAKINIPIASSTALGVIKTGYSENNKNYAVKVDSHGNAYVNVPWVSGGGNIDPTSIITAAGFKVNEYTGKDGDILFADGSYGKITGGDILMNNYGYYSSGEEPQGYVDSTDTVNDAIYKLENKIDAISGSTTPVDYISTITINGSSTGVSKTGHTVDLTMTGGSTSTVDSTLSTTSTNPVQNKAILAALNAKADQSDLEQKANKSEIPDTSNFITKNTGSTAADYLLLSNGETIAIDDISDSVNSNIPYGTAIYSNVSTYSPTATNGARYFDTSINTLCIKRDNLTWVDSQGFTVRRNYPVGNSYIWQPVCKHVGGIVDIPRFLDLDPQTDKGFPFFCTDINKQLYLQSIEINSTYDADFASITLYKYRWVDSAGRTWAISSHTMGSTYPNFSRQTDDNMLVMKDGGLLRLFNGTTSTSSNVNNWQPNNAQVGDFSTYANIMDSLQTYEDNNNGFFTIGEIGRTISLGGEGAWMLTGVDSDTVSGIVYNGNYGKGRVDTTYNEYEFTNYTKTSTITKRYYVDKIIKYVRTGDL